MIVKKNKSLILLVGCIAVSTFALSGCRSGGFKKPNLAALKFWKKNDSVAATTKIPPPPARYFDPAPLDEQIAKAKTEETIDLKSQRFNQELRESFAQKTSSLANNTNANVRSLNDLVPSGQVNGSLSNAQQEFKTAIQNKVPNGDTLKKVAEAPTKWNDFQLPADLKTPVAKPGLNQSLAGLKKSIYDADGKLVNTAQAARNSVMKKIDQAKAPLTVPTKVPDAGANQFVAAAKQKAAELSPITPSQTDFKAPSLPQSTPIAGTFGANSNKPSSFMADLKNQSASNEQLKLVQAQVADANREIELLKQQLAQSIKQPQTPIQPAAAPIAAVLPKPKMTVPQPVERVAQLKTPRFGTSSYSAANYPQPTSSVAGVSPTNILRANGQQARPSQPVTNQSAPAFPATPHGNFAPQGNFGSTSAPVAIPPSQHFNRPQPAAPVSFQTNDFQTGGFQSGGTLTLKGSTSNPTQPTVGVAKIKTHGDIPASILNGSGSYAPGSVLQVGQ